MRIRDVEVVLAVARTGSFSKGAAEVGLSQPAVSLSVKRIEEEFNLKLFERRGQDVRLSVDGECVVNGFHRIFDIYQDLRQRGRGLDALRMGLSPLLSGKDATRMLTEALHERGLSVDVEFLDTVDIARRSDLDIRIAMPLLRRRSPVFVDFPTHWIGVPNGVFIQSRQEADVWENARRVLLNSGITVERVITVNDCGYAYHMAMSGAGFTPCVATNNHTFRNESLANFPPLPSIRLDIFAPPDLAGLLRQVLSAPAKS